MARITRVDSSDIAFRTAARIAVADALPAMQPVLLEPVHEVTITRRPIAWARITALAPLRRGQILNFEPPRLARLGQRARLHARGRIARPDPEIRSATQGLGEMAFAFDHMAERSPPPPPKPQRAGVEAAQGLLLTRGTA